MPETETIAERFTRETAKHKMNVLHDDGVYRHLRFANPNTGAYWFELITTPGQLVISGDMDSFVFRRLEDMFQFFRDGENGEINPGYWAEKVVSGRDQIMQFDKEKFTAAAREHFESIAGDNPNLTLANINDALEQLESDVLNDDVLDFQETALAAADAFRFECAKGESIYFENIHEWEFKSYTWSFLWVCHAIVWGITQYDQDHRERMLGILENLTPVQMADRLVRARAATR